MNYPKAYDLTASIFFFCFRSSATSASRRSRAQLSRQRVASSQQFRGPTRVRTPNPTP